LVAEEVLYLKLRTRNLAIALVLLVVGILGAVMASNSTNNLASAATTCGINGCVSTPPLSSTTTTSYSSTSTSTTQVTNTTTTSTSISSSTTTTTATTTSTFFSYTSTISTTLTTTSYSTSYTHTQTSLNTAYLTFSTTETSSSVYTNVVSQKGIATTCPIAYVTNGNGLEPYAQFLRGFRDNKIQNTTAGRVFLTAFNSWYYSWAPTLANSAATNPLVYRVVEAGVVPLIGILYASYASYALVAPLSPEGAALTAGVVAASLIGLVYVAPTTYLTSRLLRRHLRFKVAPRTLTPTAAWLTASAIILAIAYATSSGVAMAFGTVNLVLSALSASTLAGISALVNIQPPTLNYARIALMLQRFTETR
jgi:hypothetical protein